MGEGSLGKSVGDLEEGGIRRSGHLKGGKNCTGGVGIDKRGGTHRATETEGDT